MTKPILITGASRGLGAALATALAPEYHIIAVAQTAGALENLDDRIKIKDGHATLVPLDITIAEATRQMCRSIFDRWGGLAAWFHCAIHAGPLTPVDHISQKDMEKSIAVNVTATSQLIPMVAPLLGDHGLAVFFDDPCAGQKFFGIYGATKAAQIALARSWQAETNLHGADVHVLTPAPMPTATRGRFFPGEDRSRLRNCDVQAQNILGQLNLL